MAVGLFLITWEFPHLSTSLRAFYLKNRNVNQRIYQTDFRQSSCNDAFMNYLAL